MVAGRLNHRVTVETRAQDDGPLGATDEWVSVGTYWGRVALIRLSGRTLYHQVGHSEVTHRIVLRGKVELSLADHRLRWEDQDLLLRPVEPPAPIPGVRGVFTAIVCKEYDDPPSWVPPESPPGDEGGGPLG